MREGEFREWMAHLPQWAAIVNLPSLAKFFGGRVFEGIAAGRPVVSYAVPGHPMNNSLFVEGEEILYFPASRPESLAEVLDRLLADATFATRLAGNAQRKLRTYHTSERRLAETLAWIQSGTQPEYACERERWCPSHCLLPRPATPFQPANRAAQQPSVASKRRSLSSRLTILRSPPAKRPSMRSRVGRFTSRSSAMSHPSVRRHNA
ncbi:MAG: glycosyltransferase [Nitrospira sp.]|nr:glycosyltransferase [Nitrospira sp.]